jgi:biopolymer transport protein ExbB/TolQ
MDNEFNPYSLAAWVSIGLAAGAAAWAWWSGKVWPWLMARRDTSLQHKQKIETEQTHYDILRQSWADDRMFDEFHNSAEFIRQTYREELRSLNEELNKLNRRQDQLESLLRTISGAFAEFYDAYRREH